MKTRKIFDRFEAYGWETPTREIAALVGLKPEQIVRLDTNTSPFPPQDELSQLASRARELPVNEYPDTTYFTLTRALADYCGKDLERFVVTNGADEGLDIVSKTFLDQDDTVIVPTPTYSMFRIVSELMGAKVTYLTRRAGDFSLSPDAVTEAAKTAKLVFLCNPNSPTGNVMPLDDVEKIVQGTEATVVVDEAYSEFSGKSAIELTDRYDNLIICRTFSKAFSMAGVRVGYLVASRETVRTLNLVRPPNSLSVVSLMLAETALGNQGEMRRNVARIVRERDRVARTLEGIPGVRPYPSETNFVLFRAADDPERANLLHQDLMRRGYVLRNVSSLRGTEGCLRLTIGLPAVNDGFLAALRSALPSDGS